MTDWYTKPPDEALDAVDSRRDGLTGAEAADRLAAVGPNELAADEGRGPLGILVAQFTSPLILVLLVAAGVAFAVGRPVDAALIALIVAANGVFGFVQEYRAERSLAALRDLATPEVTVRRGGDLATVPATDVVPGDVLVVEQGDVVPADARLLAVDALEVDEAALTGESLPVEKTTDALPAETPLAERANSLYSGTNVARGRGEAVVVATGMDTEIGALADALTGAEAPRTPLQSDLDRLGRRLGIGVAGLAAVVAPLLVFRGAPPVQAALAAVSLAVAAIPEGLPAVVTLTLALGVRRMADENALVRRLPAVEALGAIDVVCTDKTGTLTEGDMRVRTLWLPDERVDLAAGEADDEGDGPDLDDERVRRLLETGALCNDADVDRGDPTERALVLAAADSGIDVDALRDERPRRDTVPFSADRKRMATVHDDHVYVKGAPKVVLEHCDRVLTADGVADLDDETRERIRSRTDELADEALRVLGFAYGERDGRDDPESDLVFVGLQGLFDPPREEVADAIADTKRAGVDVKMITGDNRVTAAAIGRAVGIDSAVLEGGDVEAMSDEELRDAVEEADVFARVVPEQKVRVLRALQANGHRVAMTGDGVNDAPALKNADVGIAMGVRGTDVARQASDIVLLDDNYATIRAAIRRGRTVFDNVWKFVAYLLGANVAEVALVFVASLFGYLVLPAVQLLWINLLTDGLPALAIGTDPETRGVMERPPREGRGIVDAAMSRLVGGTAAVTAALMLALTWYTLDGAPAVTPYVTTMVFTGFVVLEFAKLYVVRWVKGSSPASNPWLGGAVAASFALQLAVLYTPLGDYFDAVPLTAGDWGLLALTLAVALPGFYLAGRFARRADAVVR